MEDTYLETIRERFNIYSTGSNGERYNIRQDKGYWISQNGKKLYPNEFDYNHLTNTIKKIEREAYDHYILPESFRIYRLLKEELALRIENDQNLDV